MIIATKTIQPVRVLAGVAGVFSDDPLPATPTLAALPAWSLTGNARWVAVWFAAVNASGARVPGVTATLGGYFLRPSSDFGVEDAGLWWFDADTRTAQSLDRPALWEVAFAPAMGVRLSSITDTSLTAVRIHIGVQETPR